MKELMPSEMIERKIFMIRGQKVMLDSDLAELYHVETKILNKAVKRNEQRFPKDFMLRLTEEEAESLRFQFGTSKSGRGGRRYLPYVFTEQGVAMLSSVLNNEHAILVNVAIMRAFVKLREVLLTHKELARKLEQLENKMERHDEEISTIFEAIRQLMQVPEPKEKKIGFIVKERGTKYRTARSAR